MSTPVGIITFLFTDIEGSAAQWQASPAAMSTAVAAHDEITRRSVERHDGTVVKSTGDGAFGVFADPLKALLGALELQRTLAQSEPQADVPLRVRAGIHVGEATRRRLALRTCTT